MKDDNVTSILDRYTDKNAVPTLVHDSTKGKRPYRAWDNGQNDGSVTGACRKMRVFYPRGKQTIINQDYITQIRYLPLIQVLFHQRYDFASAPKKQTEEDYRAQLIEEVTRDVHTVEEEIATLKPLEQAQICLERLDAQDEITIFHTEFYMSIRGVHLQKVMKPLQEEWVSNLYSYAREVFEPPAKGEPLIDSVGQGPLSDFQEES